MYSSSSQEIFNVIPDTEFDWGLDTGNIVSLTTNPVVYHIHLPTYAEEGCSFYRSFWFVDTQSYNLVLSRLQTIIRSGVSALELNGLEFMYCFDDLDMTCWGSCTKWSLTLDESSYSPGLLRPSLGSRNELKTLIREAHLIGLSIIVDLTWDCFDRNTLVWGYHTFYSHCTLFSRFLFRYEWI